MAIAGTIVIWLFWLFLLLVAVGFTVLQVFLCKMEAALPGLILPVLWFCGILILCLQAMELAACLVVFFVGNVLPAIWLGIYFFYRRKRRKHKPIDQMKIKDL